MRNLVLLIVLTAAVAPAQNNWANVKGLPVGGEIRVSLQGGKSYRGQVQNVTDESLIIVAASSQETLARPQIKKVSSKGDSHRGRNTLIGLGIGAGAGLAIGAGSDASCGGHCWFGNSIGKEVLTPVGAIIGTIIGVAWPTGIWHDIYKSK